RRAGASTTRATGPAAAGQGVALWVAITLDADPFTLAEGAETAADLTLDLAVAGLDAPKLTVRLRGFLERMPGGSRNPAREIVVEIAGLVDLSVTNRSDLKVPDSGQYPGNVRVVLHRGPVESASTFAVANEDATLAAAVAWTGSPTVVQGAVSVRSGEGTGLGDLFEALVGARTGLLARLAALESWTTPIALVAQEDPTDGTPGRQHHDGAEAALTLLAASPKADPRDAGERYRQLFPPDGTALTSEVRPSTDWVLFRRRTRKDCEGGPPVGPPEGAPVTVWIRTEDSEDEAEKVATAIQEGQWPDDGWHRADVVFEPAGSELLTPADTWRSRYRDALGGPHIALAAYAGTPTAPAAIVGPGRLDALLAATPPAADRDPDASVGVAVDPPPGRILPATVGSVFLITYRDPEPPAPQLALVGGEDTEALFTALEGADVGAVSRASNTFTRFGEFAAGDTDRDTLQRALGGKLPSNPLSARAVLWLDTSLPKADQVALAALAEQARSVAETVIAPIALPLVATVTAAPPSGMPRAALFLLTVAQVG
uniref:hypothetical protein n=1 Tax=Pseudonocardia lacus TaxID=2835865 RepID=UPI001BDD8B93